MAPLKVSREEKLFQAAIHLLEKKTGQLTSGGTCITLQSCGTQVVAWRWRAESQLWPLFVGSTTWRADPRVLPRARFKKRNSLERKGVHPHPGRSCAEDELVYPHPKELRYVWGWGGTVAVSSWVCLSHCTVKRWMCPSPDTSDASLQGFQLFLL